MDIDTPLKPEEITILLVDDNDENIFLLEHVFKSENFKTTALENGQKAIDFLSGPNGAVDLVVSDIMMPDVDGLELTRWIKREKSVSQIPIILMTAGKSGHTEIAKALELGADDFLAKPVNPVELIARARSLLRMKKYHDQLSDLNDHLEQKVEERTIELFSARDAALFGFAKLAEYRDPETGEHLERIRAYTRILAETMAEMGSYPDQITEDFILHIGFSSPLHDIGKVGIPDNILLKPGKLTDEEFEIMKEHTIIGGDTLAGAERRSVSQDGFLTMGADIAYYHHEKWQGGGYPRGLAGEDIPLAARIMSVADVYDALVSKRVYKAAFPHEKAVAIITSESGKSFDPKVVEAFEKVADQFATVKASLDDE